MHDLLRRSIPVLEAVSLRRSFDSGDLGDAAVVSCVELRDGLVVGTLATTDTAKSTNVGILIRSAVNSLNRRGEERFILDLLGD